MENTRVPISVKAVFLLQLLLQSMIFFSESGAAEGIAVLRDHTDCHLYS